MMRWLVAMAVLVLGVVPAAAEQSDRVALVVGNSAYQNGPALANPVNDARLMAERLRGVGFTVIERENLDKHGFEQAVGEFGEKLRQDGTGLVFYAGHGMQVGGRNYLIPVDAMLASEQRIKLETVDLDVVLDQMAAVRTRVSLVILDACRNNPFERKFRGGGGGGLASVSAPEGTLIAYATAPGSVAADGSGQNGLYTGELAKVIGEPGLAVEEVFKKVRAAVSKASNGAQMPWESSSLTGSFNFVAPVAAAPVPAAAPAAAAAPATLVMAAPAQPAPDDRVWQGIKDSGNPKDYETFLATYPTSVMAPIAKSRLAELSGDRGVRVEPPAAPAPTTTAPEKVASLAPAPNVKAPAHPAPPATATFDVAKIPYIDDETRDALRKDYVDGVEPKALAIAKDGSLGYIMDDEDNAASVTRRALQVCQYYAEEPCLLYAVGLRVTGETTPRPMTIPSGGKFDPATVPFVSDDDHHEVEDYTSADKHKALAISLDGGWYYDSGYATEAEARGSALKGCNKDFNDCQLYSVDDKVVFEK